jgi:hypothetical protein
MSLVSTLPTSVLRQLSISFPPVGPACRLGAHDIEARFSDYWSSFVKMVYSSSTLVVLCYLLLLRLQEGVELRDGVQEASSGKGRS